MSCRQGGQKVIYLIPFKALPNKYKDTSHNISDDNLDKAISGLGYIVANPYAVAAVNGAEPDFSDKYPNGTHWKYENGE